MKEITEIQSVSFVGSGNVATHLAAAFKAENIRIVEVDCLHHDHAVDFAQRYNCRPVDRLQQLSAEVDLILLCVPDQQVSVVSGQISPGRAIVAHTSGIEPMNSISEHLPRKGVFYPLQTFSKNREVDFSVIPFCIEGDRKEISETLTTLAYRLSNRVVSVSSPERALLHLTAVMVNNFTNMLYGMASEILEKNHIDFSLLQPLILETALKIEEMKPFEAQTGPARRKDENTIRLHLELLKDFPHYQQLYQLITDRIIKKHHE
ncbi:MAG: DUF2520 domain-containing protein [Bacteroidales bacterium]|nr:DUF2520 domain-containing protein [Bacteroidales bacterium]